MNDEESLLWVASTHAQADTAIRALHQAGIDLRKLSLIGKGYHSEEHPLGFYNVGERMRTWGGIGAFWGGLWGLLLAPVVFALPGVGVVALAGPVVSALFGALEGAVTVGALAAVSAALSSIGVAKDEIIRYSHALTADNYVLLMHGDAFEVAKARRALATSRPTTEATVLPLQPATVSATAATTVPG